MALRGVYKITGIVDNPVGGGFTGVDLKVLLNEANLHHLQTILDAGAGCGPQYGAQVAAYGRSILSLHEMCVEKTLRPDWEEAIRTFEAVRGWRIKPRPLDSQSPLLPGPFEVKYYFTSFPIKIHLIQGRHDKCSPFKRDI